MLSLNKVFNSVFKVGIGLGVGMGSLLAALPAWTAPSPVFDPILEAMTATATSPVRLPTAIPTDAELYPSFQNHFGLLAIRLDTVAGCEDSSCLGLGIVSAPEPAYWPPLDADDATIVELGNGLQGYVYETDTISALQWVQDGTQYAVSYNEEMFSLEDAIAMANSMISEPSLTEVPQ